MHSSCYNLRNKFQTGEKLERETSKEKKMMEAILQMFFKQYYVTTNHIILASIVMLYGIIRLLFKYVMRNHPKIENSDGSKKFR